MVLTQVQWGCGEVRGGGGDSQRGYSGDKWAFRVEDWPDITILGAMGMMLEGRRGEADNVYPGEAGLINLTNECLGGAYIGVAAMWIQRRRKGLMWARHETVNCRFKQLNCLSQIFRHDVSNHSYCFHELC